jgi:Acetoacetate decarboxylase (ADC)
MALPLYPREEVSKMRDDPFFKGAPRKTFDMAGEPVEFPILYYDLRMIHVVFNVKNDALKKLLPHSNYKPIEIWPGTGMLGITAFEYLDTSIGPYNEIAIGIPIKFPPSFAFPGLSAISMLQKKLFSVYIHHLPVTTEIALKGGIYFYNFPKFLSEISFKDEGQNLEVTLKEKGEMILKLKSRKLPLDGSSKLTFYTYSIKDKVVMRSLVDGWAPRFGETTLGGDAELELGSHRISRELAGLNLTKRARGGMYAEGMMTKLYEPNMRWNVETLGIIA